MIATAHALRWYQTEAIAAVESSPARGPCIVLPTGAGKSHVIAELARREIDRGGRVLVVAHRKELLEQNAAKIRDADPEIDLGIYSAGLGRREGDRSCVVAGVQSIFRRDLGAFSLVIIDEAHRIPREGEGMYLSLLAGLREKNPELRVVGLTATPFRMDCGPVCSPDGVLTEIAYSADLRRLIDEGYLSPLTSKAGVATPDFAELHLRGGEFIEGEAAALMNQDSLVRSACEEIAGYMQDRQAALIFSANVDHGRHVADTLTDLGLSVGAVFGDTPARERDELIGLFRDRELDALVNCMVLTEGFDAPHVDLVGLLRPTMSSALYVQMVGRGLRIADSKENCLVLDYGGNVQRHGPIDCIDPEPKKASKNGVAPVKVCPECRSIIALGCTTCPDCGYTFEREGPRHDYRASPAGVLDDTIDSVVAACRFAGVHLRRDQQTGELRAGPSAKLTDGIVARLKRLRGELEQSLQARDVKHVRYSPHRTDRGESLQVSYRLFGLLEGESKDWANEWIAFGRGGKSDRRASQWWESRGGRWPTPRTVSEALERAGELRSPREITITTHGQWPEVVGAW